MSPSPTTTSTSTSPAVRPAVGGWLVGPWFDALLIANVLWPLLLLAQWGDGFAGEEGLRFWQLYFVTTPHRWITLALVFLDGQRFSERRGTFVAIAVAAAAVCIGVRLSTGTLTCLLAIDYVWNAWHFASQHHGIYRIYGRLSEPGRTSGLALEKWLLRLFLLYVIVRTALATWQSGAWQPRLAACDWLAGGVALALVAADLARGRSMAGGRTLYLVSVCSLYLATLWAVHTRQLTLVFFLATASALFHAIEYLTLVAWSVQRQHAARGDTMGLLGYLAPRWSVALGIFVLVLGSGGWLLDKDWLQTWLLFNVIVSFCHYAYDGLIWRQRSGTRVEVSRHAAA